jgi:hypothetical protein
MRPEIVLLKYHADILAQFHAWLAEPKHASASGCR